MLWSRGEPTPLFGEASRKAEPRPLFPSVEGPSPRSKPSKQTRHAEPKKKAEKKQEPAPATSSPPEKAAPTNRADTVAAAGDAASDAAKDVPTSDERGDEFAPPLAFPTDGRAPPTPSAAAPSAAESKVEVKPEPVKSPPSPPPVPLAFVQAAARIDALHGEVLASARHEVLELAMELARQIVGDAVDRCDVDIAAFLDEAVSRIDDGTKITVRVHPDQRGLVDRWLGGLNHGGVYVHFDDTLGRGDVTVESGAGVVDGRIDTRLKRVESAVRAAVGQS